MYYEPFLSFIAGLGAGLVANKAWQFRRRRNVFLPQIYVRPQAPSKTPSKRKPLYSRDHAVLRARKDAAVKKIRRGATPYSVDKVFDLLAADYNCGVEKSGAAQWLAVDHMHDRTIIHNGERFLIGRLPQ